MRWGLGPAFALVGSCERGKKIKVVILARGRGTRISEESNFRIKDRYDTEVSKLEELMNKRDELRKKELMKSIEDSGKSFDEIIKFLREDSAEGDAAHVES